jgi:ATP-binding cassette subfamily B protein
MFRRINERLFSDPDGTLSLVKRALVEFGVRYWKRYALAMCCMATMAACLSVSTYLIGTAINQAYVDKSFANVAGISLLFVFLFSLKGGAAYAQAVIMARITAAMTAENQRRIFGKLLQQDIGFFADRHSSEFTARIAYGSNSVPAVIGMLVGAFGRDALTLCGLVGVMFILNPIMTLIGFFVMIPSVLFVRHIVRRVRNITLTQFSGGAEFLETLQETIQGMRVVKALGLEEDMSRRANASISSVEQATNKLARVMNRSTPLMESLGGIAVALILLYGSYRVLLANAPPGEFVSFVAAFLFAYEPSKRIARLNVELSNSLVGMKILFDLLDLPNRADDTGRTGLKVTNGRVSFENVRFEYRPNEPVLNGMSFVAEPGQMTALVGPSGGGKSTIFNLLLHFYEAKNGSIRIDDQDIADVTKASLRARIAYVGQDVFLFRGSVRQNIAYGKPGANEEEIVAAARAAHAHDFIMQFPSGYDTPVGEHGTQLSGGQRQRIAVARALVRNAPIILLDEPTASLDGESERYVQEAVFELSRGRTMLVIAHRLYTIMNANRIYVIESGQIVEEGSHATLLQAKKRYAEFFSLQFGGTSADATSAHMAATDRGAVLAVHNMPQAD